MQTEGRHDRLASDGPALLDRRRAMMVLGGAGLAATLAACGGKGSSSADVTTSTSGTSSPASSTSTPAATDASGSCSTPIPEETAGPYPGDGSNGPNVLTEDGVVRGDIRSSFGSASGVAEGVPLTVRLTVLDSASCSPVAGAAVYAWHCDREGRYSMYSEGADDENYLRGVQETDTDGLVEFTSIFPGAYSGRWPHIHFEVYSSVSDATGGGSPIATSQLAFPQDACEVVYATDGYEQSVANLARISLDTDNVFGDGYTEQLATVTGSVDGGYTAALTLSV